MPDINSLSQRIISVNSLTFDDLALEVFKLQYDQNPVYRSFVDALGKQPTDIKKADEVPFLPIEFFKTKNVKLEYGTQIVFLKVVVPHKLKPVSIRFLTKHSTCRIA